MSAQAMRPRRAFATIVALMLCATAYAQSMFRGDAAHAGAYAGSAPRQFHLDGVVYFGSNDGNLYAIE